MGPEGPQDSPAQGEPTTLSAVEPLPPGSDAEQVVDDMEQRVKAAQEDSPSGDPTEDDADDEVLETDDADDADGDTESTDAPD